MRLTTARVAGGVTALYRTTGERPPLLWSKKSFQKKNTNASNRHNAESNDALRRPAYPRDHNDHGECALLGVANWLEGSDDSYSTEVVRRILADHQLPCSSSSPNAKEPTPGVLEKVVREASAIMRASDKYGRTMEQVKALLKLHSSAPWSDLANSRQRYTADRLIQFLGKDGGLESFMDQADLLSFRLHEMLMSAGDQIYRLKPDLMRSPADREAFKGKVDRNFVASGAGMGERQCRTLLLLVAKHMNEMSSSGLA